MRPLLFAYICSGIYLWHLLWHLTDGQYFEDPTKTFQNFSFDWLLRGSFNISSCLVDLMTCWENIKPDIICSQNVHMDSVCTQMKHYCHDFYGDIDSYKETYTMYESYCRHFHNEKRT